MKVTSQKDAKQRRKMIRYAKIAAIATMFVLIVVLLAVAFSSLFSDDNLSNAKAPDITEDLLTPNAYSRPQIELTEVKGIVIHYTGNAGTSAKENRDYFENLMNTKATFANTHFIVGLSGEIIQCLPINEASYATLERNTDTLSIEYCHAQSDGKPNEATYQSLVELTAWLCKECSLTAEQVTRHYDETGKPCPLYFVQNEDAWDQFLTDVTQQIAKLK